MKKTIYLILLVLSVSCFAQHGSNPFAEPESRNTFSRDQGLDERSGGGKVQPSTQKDLDTGGGNPGDPAPIDDYLPLLVVVAVGLIVYHVRKQKQLS